MRRLDDLPQDCHLSVNHSKVKIFIDTCNSAKTMLLDKGSSLAVGRGHGFISIIKSSARVIRKVGSRAERGAYRGAEGH